MSEFKETLVRIGVLDPDGELADHYCSKKQLKEKRRRAMHPKYIVEGLSGGGSTCYLVDGAWIKKKYISLVHINIFNSIDEAKQAVHLADDIYSHNIRELTPELTKQLSE